MPKSTRQRAHPQGTSARNLLFHAPTRIVRQAAPDLSRRARVRLEMLDWHERHGRNVSRTARHFGYSRPTVYRWLGRYEPRPPRDARGPRPGRPLRRRRPTWTLARARRPSAVSGERYPRWGKDKLAGPPPAGGAGPLGLDGRADPRAPPAHRASCGSPPAAGSAPGSAPGGGPTPCASPRASSPRSPGDLVQVDTLDVRPVAGLVLKQFTARDVVSRWDVLELRTHRERPVGRRDPRRARRRGCRSGPGPPVDGGSEFMAELRGGLRGAGDRPARAAARAAPSSTAGRAGQPHPHRGVLRGHRRRARRSPACGPRCSPGRRRTTPSGPTRPSATSRPAEYLASTQVLMCNGGTGRVHRLVPVR